MSYSHLNYQEYIENIDYWFGTFHVLPPRWAQRLDELGYESISALDFYDDLFGEDLEPHRLPKDYQTGDYAAIALEIDKETVVDENGKEKEVNRGHRTTVTQGNSELYDLIDRTKLPCYIAPVSYAGRNRLNENARFLYALCVEVDNIERKNGLEELFYTFKREVRPIPRPTYIVCSGNGLHLYWKFVKPIPLFQNIFEQFQEIKTYMTRNLWDKQISNEWRKVQYESVCQSFRCVGTSGKNRSKRAMAFKVGSELTIEEFNERLPEDLRLDVVYKSKLTREKAKELYPIWYKRRIEEGAQRGHYDRAPGIYYNWIKKIMDPDNGAEVGHRYNCLENLCSLAVQCGIGRNQVEKDCRMVAEYFEELTVQEDNHFTEFDINCALRTYNQRSEGAYRRKIEYISKKTGIALTPNKRNGRKQKEHLQRARAVQSIDYPDGSWRNKDGRPKGSGTAQKQVEEWRKNHPDGKKADCIRDTGLSKPTVYKWW